MRPRLLIGPLTQLQDARSSAAVGFDFVSFSLERGSHRKMSAPLVWNITQWISGPEIVIETSRESLEELEEAAQNITWRYVSFPASEWGADLAGQFPAVLLRADTSLSPGAMKQARSEAEAAGTELLFELSVADGSDLWPYRELMPYLFLHASRMEDLLSLSKIADNQAFGLSLREEAEEEPGQLDYLRIDDWIEDYQRTYPLSDLTR